MIPRPIFRLTADFKFRTCLRRLFIIGLVTFRGVNFLYGDFEKNHDAGNAAGSFRRHRDGTTDGN